MIIRNTNPFEYYIIQQLFNDVNVPRCHTENLSYENIFFPFKYILLLLSQFCFLGTNIKGTIFSGRVRSHPPHPPQLCVWWQFQKHIYHNNGRSCSIHLVSLNVFSEQKIKMKTRNTIVLSYHSKTYFYSKRGSPIFLLFCSWSVVLISMFRLS